MKVKIASVNKRQALNNWQEFNLPAHCNKLAYFKCQITFGHDKVLSIKEED